MMPNATVTCYLLSQSMISYYPEVKCFKHYTTKVYTAFLTTPGDFFFLFLFKDTRSLKPQTIYRMPFFAFILKADSLACSDVQTALNILMDSTACINPRASLVSHNPLQYFQRAKRWNHAMAISKHYCEVQIIINHIHSRWLSHFLSSSSSSSFKHERFSACAESESMYIVLKI